MDALKLRLEFETARADSAMRRLEAAFAATLRRMGRSEDEIRLLQSIEREVAAGKRSLESLPAAQRAVIARMREAARGVELLDAVGMVRSHRQIRESIDELRSRYAALARSGVVSSSELAEAQARVASAISRMRAEMAGAQSTFDRFGGSLSGLRSSLGLLGGSAAVASIARISDEMARLSGRLELAEGSAQLARLRLAELATVAQRAAVPIADVAGSYAQMAASVRAVGGSTQQAVQLQEALALALRTSGAGAQEAGAVMRQLGQALQRGKLAGDEFVSVAENGGRILDYLARELGVTRGELAAMAQAGDLTADKILRLGNALGQIRADAQRLPASLGDAMTRLRNASSLAVSESRLIAGAMSGAATAVEAVARNFDALAGAAVAAGGAFAAVKLAGGSLATVGSAIGAAAAGLAALNPAVLAAGAGVAALAAAFAAMRAGPAQDTMAGVVAQAEAARAALTQTAGAIATTISAIEAAIVRAREQAGAAAESLLAATLERSAITLQSTQAQLAAIEARSAQAAQSIEARSMRERERTAELAELARETERQRVAAVESAQIRILTSIETAAQRIRAVSYATTADIERVERDTAVRRQGVWEALAEAYQASIGRLMAANARYEADITRIEAARLQYRATTEDRIREMQRASMDAYSAYQDRVRQIDEQISAARRALADGDYRRAEEIGRRAADMATAIGAAVTESVGGVARVVVDQATAQAAAIDRIRQAQGVVDDSLRSSAERAREEIKRNTEAIRPLEERLAEARSQAEALRHSLSERLSARIDIDTTALDAAVERVNEGLDALKRGVSVRIAVEEAQQELDRFRADPRYTTLEMSARAKVDEATRQIDALRAEAQRLGITVPAGLDGGPARAQMAQLVRELSAAETESQHRISHNADLARREIMGLDGLDTSSTHTVYVRRVEARAGGGLVGDGLRAIARLARGGPVFRRQRSGWVSGYGYEDTEPRTLDAGAYVLRRAAADRYRALLPHLARGGMAQLPRLPRTPIERTPTSGGSAIGIADRGPGGLQAEVDAMLAEAIELRGRRFGAVRSAALAALETAIRRYRMSSGRTLALDPLAEVVSRRWAEQMLDADADAYRRALAARRIADADMASRSYGERAISIATPRFAISDDYGSLFDDSRRGRYAAGGIARGSDTVPAMLTPGEYVVPRDVVRRYGVGFFERLNRLAMPLRHASAAVLGSLRYYSAGGLVPPTTAMAAPQSTGGATHYTQSVNIHASSAQSARELARILLPEMEALMRRRS